MICNLSKTYIYKGTEILDAKTAEEAKAIAQNRAASFPDNLKEGTIAYKILRNHNTSGSMDNLQVKFDALTSHDITYVGIIQTARASGLKEFPVPYVLTNCHNSLCAVGGTLNEDDHRFGYSAAVKYGGIYVPPHVAVIHSFAREELAGCGKMILGSDSHTRYGALGTMAIGEGGPELVKQLLKKTYDINYPEVVAVYLTGAPAKGVGPHDVALALIKEVFPKGLVKNKVLEFVGPGIANLSVDFRNGIDVMTTETACLSSIWMTDDKVKEYYGIHRRPEAFEYLNPADLAEYDSCVVVDLSKIEPMIALPFHPSNAYTIKEFKANAKELLANIEKETEAQFKSSGLKAKLTDKLINGEFYVDQGVIAGCAGGIYENIMAAADILKTGDIGDGAFSLSVYPASQSVFYEITKNGAAADLMAAGAIMKTAFCGPCFGAGDVPSHNGFSIRHTTRNFPNREGSKPGDGQISYVALMDARSIAATALNHGKLTAATEIDAEYFEHPYTYHRELYEKRVYNGWGKPFAEQELILGPNIADWPKIIEMPEHLLLKNCCVIRDPVTTTDELIPSGETSTLRSNPFKLSEFTLSRKAPYYVGKAKNVRKNEESRQQGSALEAEYTEVLEVAKTFVGNLSTDSFAIGSMIYANLPGDGSAREQAASCQKVLGGWANIAQGYATKRYRSNLINWGILPLLCNEETAQQLEEDQFIFLPNIKNAVLSAQEDIEGYIIKQGKAQRITLSLGSMTETERDILTSGGLINYYSKK